MDVETRIREQLERMAARVTESLQYENGAFAESRRTRVRAGAVGDAFVSLLSRELRLSLDGNDRFRLVEGAWQSVLGWQPERLGGLRWDQLVHPADHATFDAALGRLRQGRDNECRVDVRVSHATGGYCAMAWTLARGSGPDEILGLGQERPGRVSGEAGGGAERGRLQARITELEQKLAAMETFAGMAAHQLAEPLIIAESAAILVTEELNGSLAPFLQGRLDAITRASGRARRLMDALLADARASTEKPHAHPVDVGTSVAQTLSSFEPLIKEHRIVVHVDSLPSVLADPALLAVVLDNLVSNAVKHGPRENGVISIGSAPVAGGWRISVTSGGPPIPVENVRQVLEPYVRLPGERRVSGSGLGLAICVRLIERMGGTFGVTAGRVEGNTFWFALPAAPTLRA